ncbi:MAG: SDR family oxidoreductase [Fibrobacterales bacterium]
MKIEGSKILITGGSSGIGKATAQLLIEKGATVVITGRDTDKLTTVAQEIGAHPLHFDISQGETIVAKSAEAIALLGGIDVLINNAGIGEFGLLEEVTLDQFERVFSTNVFGLAMLTQAILPHLKAAGKGSIVNIASSAATKGFAYGTVYSASKFALRAMTQCWQAELRKENIRVIGINPSEVPTAFNKTDRVERPEELNKLSVMEIAEPIVSALEMDDRGFIPELSVWATNPF